MSGPEISEYEKSILGCGLVLWVVVWAGLCNADYESPHTEAGDSAVFFITNSAK